MSGRRGQATFGLPIVLGTIEQMSQMGGTGGERMRSRQCISVSILWELLYRVVCA